MAELVSEPIVEIKRAVDLKLTPIVHPIVSNFLSDQKLCQDLVNALGSPLNVLFPQIIKHNVESFHTVFAKHQIMGKVFFAHKSNQSTSLLRQMSVEKICVDVSSANELKHALACGIAANRIEASGPKNQEFIGLSILHNIPINVDSLAELNQILSIKKFLGISKNIKLILRVSGFKSAHSNFISKNSRFGIPPHSIDEAFYLLAQHKQDLSLAGFAFHIASTNIPERAVAIENCFEYFEMALSRGFEPHILNIGGGYKVNYLASRQQWEKYSNALREAVLGKHESLTWQDNGFGLSTDNGKLKGSLNTYDYYNDSVGAEFLDEILNYELPAKDYRSIATMLRDNMIELWIEPGRSIMDQTGITLARVNSIRTSSLGDNLILLNMKRQDLSLMDDEIFIDPIILYKNNINSSSQYAVFFAGNLCVENDLIYRHKTFLTQLPESGDIVSFINSAAYFMDFSASRSIMHPTGRKIAIRESNSSFEWFMDDQYLPY